MKRLEQTRYDRLFVLTGDWRCWFIPSDAVEGRSGISLGGPKYCEYEVEINLPLPHAERPGATMMGEAGFEPA